MIKLLAVAIIVVANIALVFGDEDIHHLTEEEFCKLPKDKKTKLWDCMQSKLPGPVKEQWTKCAKDVYGVSSVIEAADKMCSDKDEKKHDEMEKCCENSKKELTEDETKKLMKDCFKSM